MSAQPRSEHPRPQFVRPGWLCLNGEWQFEIDQADSGLERGVRDRELRDRIIVPFAPESTMSGIGNIDFLEAVWYRKASRSRQIGMATMQCCTFSAVEHDTTVWVNGIEVVRHRGGFTPFSADLSQVHHGCRRAMRLLLRKYPQLRQVLFRLGALAKQPVNAMTPSSPANLNRAR